MIVVIFNKVGERMFCVFKLRHIIYILLAAVLLSGGIAVIAGYGGRDTAKKDVQEIQQTEMQNAIAGENNETEETEATALPSAEKKDFIKWVEFNVPCQAMRDALEYDIAMYEAGTPVSWVDLLAYLGAKNGGDFSKYKTADMEKLKKKLQEGTGIEELTRDMKYFSYYQKAYGAVLNGFVGPYQIEKKAGESSEKQWEEAYGLKVFSPIAKGYAYNDFDDFGTSRSYGYKRKHLGHDLMALVGTPVVAVESGTVEAVGWNQYGGWRIGIRSFDRQRYYYYAHLRKNMPYNACVTEGATIKAGDVIGYVGRTGYSAKENVNNIDTPHLHFGIQLIFDESQKDGNNEIWIDCYQIMQLLSGRRVETVKNEETKEYSRVLDFHEPALDQEHPPLKDDASHDPGMTPEEGGE